MNYAHGNYDNFSGFYLIHRKLQKSRGTQLDISSFIFQNNDSYSYWGSVRYPTERKR